MSAPDLLATCWTTAGDALPVPGRDASPLDLPTRVAAAARAGFTGFGLLHVDLAAYLRTGDLRSLRSLLDDHGMRHVELELVTGWGPGGGQAPSGQAPSGQTQSDRVLRLLLEAAEVLRPHHVKVGPDTTGAPFELEPWAEAWTRVCAAFDEVGTRVGLEFLPFANVASVAEAVELVRTAGHPAGGLLIDLWHVMRGGTGGLAQLDGVPLDLIVGVELDDADAVQVGDAFSDTILRRRLPGEGDWPVAEAIRRLHDLGWRGPWGVEILSETFRVRPLDESLPDVVRATRRQFELAGVGSDRVAPDGLGSDESGGPA